MSSSSAPTNTTGALIVGIFMAFVGLGGLAMMFLGLKKPKVAEFKMTQTTERTILSVARHHGGKVTVSELALETQLTLDECQTVLDQLASRDVAQVHVGTAGETVYAFPGLMVDKSSAVDPLDDVAAFDAALGSVALDFETDGDPGRSAEDEQVVASVHHTKHEG